MSHLLVTLSGKMGLRISSVQFIQNRRRCGRRPHIFEAIFLLFGKKTRHVNVGNEN